MRLTYGKERTKNMLDMEATMSIFWSARPTLSLDSFMASTYAQRACLAALLYSVAAAGTQGD